MLAPFKKKERNSCDVICLLWDTSEAGVETRVHFLFFSPRDRSCNYLLTENPKKKKKSYIIMENKKLSNLLSEAAEAAKNVTDLENQ